MKVVDELCQLLVIACGDPNMSKMTEEEWKKALEKWDDKRGTHMIDWETYNVEPGDLDATERVLYALVSEYAERQNAKPEGYY